MQVQIIEGIGGYLIIATLLMVLYFWILRRLGFIKTKTTPSMANVPSAVAAVDIIPKQSFLMGQASSMTLPPEATSIPVSELDEDENFEFLDDDKENLLLREAEKVIDKVQDEINHIASNPPNPEEVSSKIRAVISPLQLFNDTEYYGAINAYIALAVERDLGITLSSEEVKALWN